MKNEKNKTKKEVKGKNFYHSEQTMAALQSDNPSEIWELLLYLRENGFRNLELAYRTSLGESELRRILKIRLEGFKATMLSLQHKPRRSRGRFLGKNGSGKRSGIYGQIKGGKKHNSKSIRPLSIFDNELRKNLIRPKRQEI